MDGGEGSVLNVVQTGRGGERIACGRRFADMTQLQLQTPLEEHIPLKIRESWTSDDAGGRIIRWVNAIAQRANPE